MQEMASITDELQEAISKFDSSVKPTIQEVLNYYNQWAQDYDKDSATVAFRAAELLSEYADRYISDKSTLIMDICSGTGRGAVELKKRGFANIDALDGSVAMLEIARTKNLYSNYFCECLQPGQETKIPANQYGAVVCIGSFVGGHLKPEVADEFLRILKPGGFCLVVMREQFLYDVPEYKDKLEPYITKLKGWELLERTVVQNYFGDLSGVVFVFQKNQH